MMRFDRLRVTLILKISGVRLSPSKPFFSLKYLSVPTNSSYLTVDFNTLTFEFINLTSHIY